VKSPRCRATVSEQSDWSLEAIFREGPPRIKDIPSDSPSQETGAIRHTNPFRV